MSLRVAIPLAVARSLWRHAGKIGAAKYTNGIRTARNTPYGRSQRVVDYIGLRGEWAVANVLGEDVNYELTPKGVPECDLTHRGRLVEVKTTLYRNGCLMLRNPEEFRADLMVLCVDLKHQAAVEVIGTASKPFFKAHHKRRDFGHGMRIYLDQAQLTPMTWDE